MSGSIGSDQLFLGLTRPSMILGVSYTFAGLNAMSSMFTFIMTENLFYLLLMMPAIHLVAWFICLKEPRALEIFISRYSKCNSCVNRYYFNGTNSYDTY